MLEQALSLLIQKSSIYIQRIAGGVPEYLSCQDGEYIHGEASEYRPLRHIFSWTQSFFAGMVFWAFKVTRDEKYLQWLHGLYTDYYAKVFDTPMETMHDLGFLYSPYAVAMYKATGDVHMKELGIRAADELTKRFNPKGQYIRAWGRIDDKVPDYVDPELANDPFYTQSKGLAIIDCMMNLPLLFWASEVTGHPYYKLIAEAHADSTLKHFIRLDGSVYHAYRFDEKSGNPICGCNYCGYDAESFWARGTTWAIYGFIRAYYYTGNELYLDTSIKLSHQFIDNCEEDGIPVWDFRLPFAESARQCGVKREWMTWDISNSKNRVYNRDSSAAAIAACAFYDILKVRDDAKIRVALEHMICSLTGIYLNTDPTVPGALKRQNGQDVYTIFGDYYLMEALGKLLYGFESVW